ncbi:acetate--CoA ligase family protein [Arthrobacter psychrochitiniphilus]|uniref:Acid--CoA ligase n=1 Tax=Arthrobacter psychrochitiniphilus TaxID=291045 RepID=A0A2V3DVQ9_9MICC|nr:acetate--CoA ligase family protein [Arthrobacter psychrochitiniphilus]NYG16666.1 acyl-CoA synthetase (NDP forming) [Arthrobacter psychrochitiniphilus]PXA69223.1 acid--CoA ligase [Arthrobacter psychrochitiniphilus]
MPASSLKAFRDPSSVAVVGASDDQAKWGYWLARGALSGAHRRDVYLVNGSAATVQNETAYSSISALPGVPELVVLCVPPRFVTEVVREALAAGVKAFLGITAGVLEEEALGAMIRAAGARIIGPNSLGLFDASSSLQLAWGHFSPGPLAIISQSGQLGSELAILAARAGMGVSRFVSIGNQLDVNAAELVADLADHEQSKIIALYLESFTSGVQLVETIRDLSLAGKTTLVLTTGASDASQRLAQSHTGSLTSALDTVDAACRAAGAIRVATPTELVNAARYLSVAAKPASRRTALISDSGGQGGIAADVAAVHGLDAPIFSEQLQRQLAEILPAGAAVSNPIDLAGAGEANLDVYADLVEVLMSSGEVDSVVLSGYFGCYGSDTPAIEARELSVADRMADIVKAAGMPLVVHSMSSDSAVVARLWADGIPTYPGIEIALRTLSLAAQLSASPGRVLGSPEQKLAEPESGYWQARAFLAELGISAPEGRLANNRADVARASEELRYPLVLKAGWLEHKSEHDGVKLGLGSAEQLMAAFEDMQARLGDGEYVVEEQDIRQNTVEVLVGARQDRDFGPVVTVGAGGTETELHKDISVELAPVDHATALEMIGRLKCLPLLQGWRGRPATDIQALAAMVVSISEAVAANQNITEFEVNPIRVAPEGALAVDALVLTAAAVNA